MSKLKPNVDSLSGRRLARAGRARTPAERSVEEKMAIVLSLLKGEASAGRFPLGLGRAQHAWTELCRRYGTTENSIQTRSEGTIRAPAMPVLKWKERFLVWSVSPTKRRS